MINPHAVPREKVVAAVRGLILLTVLLMARSQAGPRTASFELVVSVGAAYVLVSTFLPWARFDLRRATLAMLAADIALVTALLYTQSGIASDYYLLYYLPILHAGVRLNFRDAVGTSLLSAASYVLVAFGTRSAMPITTHMVWRVATFTASALVLGGFFFVLSQQQRAHERLRKSYEEAMQAKTEFLSRVSHEFRTPLTAIVGFSQLLYDHEKTLDLTRQHEYLVIVREQSQHLARMIEDMLDIARIEEGRLVLKRQPTNLAEAIDAALMLLDHPSDRERVEVSVEPQTPVAEADKNEIEQALARLLLTVLSLAGDSAAVSVGIGPAVEEGAVQVAIRAPGIEAADDELAPLFESPASAVARATESGRYLGLGVARALIGLHGGRIWLDDGYESGAAICFTLPTYRTKEAGPEVIVGKVGSGSVAAEGYGDGQNHDCGRRPVRAEANAGQP